MKAKYVLFGMGLLMATAGLWFGRAAWRAHRQIVSLHLRNAPLEDVLRKIERQTWTKIRAERDLNARITLNVTDKPLAQVLDRISEQAGARWSTVRAVYGSDNSLRRLESVLGGDGKLEPVGWTKLAPTIRGHGQEAGDMPLDLPGSGLAANGGRIVTATEDVQIPGPRGTNFGAAGTGSGTRGPGPMVVRMVRRGGDGPESVQEEVWTHEELVMESALKGKLGTDEEEGTSPEAAAAVAGKVGGKWTTYFALRKSRIGFGFGGLGAGMPGGRRVVIRGKGPQLDGVNSNGMSEIAAPSQVELENAMLRKRNDELGKLTPEQRVQRARERSASPQP